MQLMLPWTSENGETTLTIYPGHVLDVLRQMPAESVHCVVTSPPYWGLRDYKLPPQVWGGEEGCEHAWVEGAKDGEVWNAGKSLSHGGTVQKTRAENPEQWSTVSHKYGLCLRCSAWRGSLGLEPTPDLYVQHLTEIFREVRRVLRRDGTVWLNLGDAYAANGGWSDNSGLDAVPRGKSSRGFNPSRKRVGDGIKPKDLLGMPWRVAFALQADGWWLRSEITWCKSAPMPESVRDRPTSATEKVFLLAKSESYFFDQTAVREPASGASLARISQPTFGEQKGGKKDYGSGVNPSRSARKALENFSLNPGRNIRNWWLINPEPFPEAHFATFPQKLVEPCILAGTSEKGCCPDCGAPWDRMTEKGEPVQQHWAPGTQEKTHIAQGRHGATSVLNTGYIAPSMTTGWQPTCTHGTEHLIPQDDLDNDPTLLDGFEIEPYSPVPCTILDPFLGSGTTLLVAQRLGRNGIGIELNPSYVEMAKRRLLAEHGQIKLGIKGG